MRALAQEALVEERPFMAAKANPFLNVSFSSAGSGGIAAIHVREKAK